MSDVFDWIRLECIPLPDSEYPPCIVFWNPKERILQGDAADQIMQWIQDAEAKGYISTATLSHFEIVNPLSQPSELAAILAQYYWVIPQPVRSPDENPAQQDEGESNSLLH